MALNPKYVVAPSLQSYFVDKSSGFPLAGGKVFCYSDVNRTTLKDVYELQGNQANYTYVPLPNPIILSAVGTIQDNNGNDIIPYWYPYEASNPNVQELYYIVVQDANGVPQFTRQAWPNPENGGGGDITSAEEINLVPNGQMLAHTNLPDNLLVSGDNPIAQGGIYVVLDPDSTSTNTLTFTTLAFNQLIPQSPRYEAQMICSEANPAEDFKKISVRWDNVTKFSTGSDPQQNTYQFGFWAESNVTLNTNIQIYMYYGSGSSSEATVTPIQSDTITSSGQYYSYTITFPVPTGTIDIVNNDDYVAVEILLPTDLTFTLEFTDFAMIPGNQILSGPPVQTDADMLTRGVAGWMTTPNPNGSDLYLPLILTREGMKFDDSEIGSIFAFPGMLDQSTQPFLLCDGSSYLDSAYSALGIPYFRLGNYLRNSGSIDNYPIYGTGINYGTGWQDYSGAAAAYIIVNSSGAGVSPAINGNTANVTFNNVMTFNGVQTGSASLGYLGEWNGSTGVIAKGNFTTAAGSITQSGVSFTPTLLDGATGLYSYQNIYAFSIICTAASTLGVVGGNCAYFQYFNSTDSIRIHYRVAGVGNISTGATNNIIIDMPASTTAVQVAQLTAYAMSSLQVSYLVFTGTGGPGDGTYFTFQTNPGAARTIQPYYAYTSSTPAPVSPVGELVRISLPSNPTNLEIAMATYEAINGYQYAVPDLEGMFLRGIDPNSIYDLDRLFRFSQSVGPGGLYGSYELQQFLSHSHVETIPLFITVPGTGNNVTGTSSTTSAGSFSNSTAFTGGSETRPVNSYVNWAIKY